MSNPVSETYCKEHGKMLDERFRRDKEDIEKHERTISELKDLTKEISALVKQNDTTIKNHENRIVQLEKKPSMWLDRIISALISAAIAAVITILGGKS